MQRYGVFAFPPNFLRIFFEDFFELKAVFTCKSLDYTQLRAQRKNKLFRGFCWGNAENLAKVGFLVEIRGRGLRIFLCFML